MTVIVRRYAQRVIDETQGSVLDPDCQTPFLSDEAQTVANKQIALMERRDDLYEFIWASGNIDVVYVADPGLEETTNDPRVMVRRVAFLCLQQAVVNLAVASSAVA